MLRRKKHTNIPKAPEVKECAHSKNIYLNKKDKKHEICQ